MDRDPWTSRRRDQRFWSWVELIVAGLLLGLAGGMLFAYWVAWTLTGQ